MVLNNLIPTNPYPSFTWLFIRWRHSSDVKMIFDSILEPSEQKSAIIKPKLFVFDPKLPIFEAYFGHFGYKIDEFATKIGSFQRF